MNQSQILRNLLEEVVGDNSVDEYRNTRDRNIEVIATRLLDEVPKENSEHVKAFRAAECLLDYIEDHDYDFENPGIGPPFESQLLNLRGDVRGDAIDSIADRIMVENDDSMKSFGSTMVHTEIYDPVTKMNRRVVNPLEGQEEMHIENLAHEILHKNL